MFVARIFAIFSEAFRNLSSTCENTASGPSLFIASQAYSVMFTHAIRMSTTIPASVVTYLMSTDSPFPMKPPLSSPTRIVSDTLAFPVKGSRFCDSSLTKSGSLA